MNAERVRDRGGVGSGTWTCLDQLEQYYQLVLLCILCILQSILYTSVLYYGYYSRRQYLLSRVVVCMLCIICIRRRSTLLASMHSSSSSMRTLVLILLQSQQYVCILRVTACGLQYARTSYQLVVCIQNSSRKPFLAIRVGVGLSVGEE